MRADLARIAQRCITLLVIGGIAQRAHAQAIPAKTLENLKAATTFVKVKRRTFEWSGSGFVAGRDKDDVLIVTNAHVLLPPRIDDAQISKNVSRETLQKIFEMQKEVSGVKSEATVVFNSGTPQERTLGAQLIAEDDFDDLAVLKVTGAPEVKPLRPEDGKLVETTVLVALGFPFGGILAANDANPTITIARAELTSIKPITGDFRLLQLQGALNPGSSGGPVVDAQGRVRGVQVAVIPGSGVGFAIPVDRVTKLMRGSLSLWRMAARRMAGDEVEVEFKAWVVDPRHRLDSFEVSYVPGATPAVTAAEFKAAPRALADAKSIELKRDGMWAVCKFTMPVSGDGPLVATVQPSWKDSAHKKHLARPQVVRISLGKASGSAEDGRSFWRYVDPRKGEGWMVRTEEGWDEDDDGATHHFAEVTRNPEFVELFDKKRNIRVRLLQDKMLAQVGNNSKWIRLYAGAWEATGRITTAD